MKQKVLISALGASLALMLSAAAITASPANGSPDPDRVLIKFKPGSKGLVQAALKSARATVHYSFDNIDTFAATVPAQALNGLRRNPNIEFIEPDQIRRPAAQTVPYGIDMVQAREVWDADRNGTIDSGAPTGDGMLVCVIDSGIHAGHEDFAGVNIVGGFPKDTWNFDNCGHGTHVAGTIVAANNSTGVVGVSPGKASLFIVKVFGNDGVGSCGYTFSSQLIDAANRCAEAGAKVINMSLGGGGSRGEEMAFRALDKRGVLSIAAAGNHGDRTLVTDPYSYPASYNSVVSVAAIDSSKALASFSARNDQVELSAPGVDVLSTTPFVFPPLLSGGDSYDSVPMTNSYQGQATAALVNGGLCTSPAADNSWVGKVVLCQRGSVSFLAKAQNVASSGGVATVIYNNRAGPLNGTLGNNLTVIPAIPVVGITTADGQALLAAHIGDATTVDSVLQTRANGYEFYNGTSMATPHVAGVAALIWSANPGWSNQQVREALNVTAEDLGAAGYDTGYGWGLVRARSALNELQDR